MLTISRRMFFGATAGLFAPPIIVHAGTQTGIELNMLFDFSGSMFSGHTQIGSENILNADVQLEGHAKGLLSKSVSRLLIRNQVVLRATGWNERGFNICGPTKVTEMADVQAFVDALRISVPLLSPKNAWNSTHHDTGVTFALKERRLAEQLIVDVCTDESIFRPRLPACLANRTQAIGVGAKINVLAIGCDLLAMQEFKEALATPDGFVFATDSWARFEAAIQMKFLMELA